MHAHVRKHTLGNSELCVINDGEKKELNKLKREVWADFDFGQKENPSRWVTLLALRIVKRIAPFRHEHFNKG